MSISYDFWRGEPFTNVEFSSLPGLFTGGCHINTYKNEGFFLLIFLVFLRKTGVPHSIPWLQTSLETKPSDFVILHHRIYIPIHDDWFDSPPKNGCFRDQNRWRIPVLMLHSPQLCCGFVHHCRQNMTKPHKSLLSMYLMLKHAKTC